MANMQYWLDTDEGKKAIEDTYNKINSAIAALKDARKVTRQMLNTPMDI